MARSAVHAGAVHNATVTTQSPPDPVAERPSRRARQLPLKAGFTLGLVLVLVLAAGGWVLSSGLSAGRVHTAWVPTCQGTDVYRYTDSGQTDQDLVGEWVIDSRPGFTCTVSITVTNNSPLTAHLTSIDGSFLGPRGGAEFMGATSSDLPVLEPGSSAVDASYPIDQQLAGGDSVTIDLVITWREKGCNSAGLMTVRDWPGVRLDVLGMGHDVTADQAFIFQTHDDDRQGGTIC